MPALLNAPTSYSLLYGVLTPERLCATARALGYDTVALSDRNNLYALPQFLYQAAQHKLRPIIGVELVVGGRDFLLYSSGDSGYAALCRIITRFHCTERFSLLDELKEGSEGLWVVGEDIEQLSALREHAAVHYRMRTPRRPPPALRASGITPLIIPQSAFESDEDYRLHRMLCAIDANTTLSALSPQHSLPCSARIESWAQVRERFEVFEEALEATERFGDAIRSRTTFGTPVLPELDSRTNALDKLRTMATDGARWRYGDLTPAITQRLDYELSIIGPKGFASYFLVVHDIVKQSPRTCGRGSAAASLVSYCLGITNVDPLRHNLMFERFLNPGRLDPPDIDVDFAWDERDGVLDYVFAKYGSDHAAMVANHNTFGGRMALRQVARVYGLTESEISAVTKKLPYYFDHDNAPDALATEVRSHTEVALDEPWGEIIGWAQKLVGLPCGIGTHCGGVVITPDAITNHAPLQRSAKGYPIVQWEKDGVEEMGLVKIDLLGNRSLAVIRDAIADIRRQGIDFDERRWDPVSDPLTLDMLARGRTMGVFYVESPAMRLLQERTAVGDFEHMVIHSSIIRPAASKYQREYIRRLHGARYTPLHPALGDTLSQTYGIMVYQEDVSRVAMSIAGFSAEDGDGLRKIMSKKDKRGRLEHYYASFVQGARERGVSDTVIEQVWQMMLSFSGYSFCKPHSASYVQVSFQSAWLKAHYPAEFMAAVISNFGGFYTTQAYVSEAQRLGLRVEGPEVNHSGIGCHGQGRTIRVGLSLVRGLSVQTQRSVVQQRRGGAYGSLDDFLQRSDSSEAQALLLVSAGACDSLEPGSNRAQLFWKLRTFFRNRRCDTQVPSLQPSTPLQLLGAQYRMLGFLSCCHPITLLRPPNSGCPTIRRLRGLVGRSVRFYGWCVTSRTLSTVQGEPMQFVTFEDESGIIEVVLFAPVYRRFSRAVQSREAFCISGRVINDDGAVMVEGSSVVALRELVMGSEGVKSVCSKVM
jgi:DNA polymerase-3 subunit alpha/error-prone DNA polymerase